MVQKRFSDLHVSRIKKEALPKGSGFLQTLIETDAFFEAYKEDGMSTYQLIQIVGCQVAVSNAAAWLIVEQHINYN
jgi:Mg2+/citrate symporter